MNICILDYSINPPWVEAVRKLALELSRKLVEEGHSVHVVTSASINEAFEEEIDGVFFHRIFKTNFLSYHLARKVKTLHKSYRFDVIHIQNSLMKKSFLIALLLLKKWVKVPLVAYICLQPTISLKVFIQLIKLKPRANILRLFGWSVDTLTPRFYVKQEFKLVDKIITSSNYLKNIITRIGIEPNKIDTIYPFINIQEFTTDLNCTHFRTKFGIDKNTPLILYVGSTESARLGGFLKALPIVLNKIPDSKIVLVTPPKKEFLSSITKFGLKDAVIVLPQHVEIIMSNLMVTSDVFIYPGFSAIVSADPPLSIIEAMTLRIPIVASDTGGIAEITKNYKDCFLVNPLNHVEIANALIKLLNNKRVRAYSCSQRLLEVDLSGSEYNSKIACKRFLSFYRSVITTHLQEN